jgi:hypothetical protein
VFGSGQLRAQAAGIARERCIVSTGRHSFWARAYYAQQRAKGSTHQAATRALAFKWIRILYRCWQTKTPYDESTYLNALARRGSPLIRQLANVS